MNKKDLIDIANSFKTYLSNGKTLYQNKRCSGLFKEGKNTIYYKIYLKYNKQLLIV